MNTPPPLNLADEQVRVVLTAACEALAAAPGALYPVVYVGPLRSPSLLRRAAEAAAEAAGVLTADWTPGWTVPETAVLLLCPVSAAGEARSAAAGKPGQQLIVWGDGPGPVEAALDGCPVDLAIDLREHSVPRGAGAWLGASVEGTLRGPGGPANPLVVLTGADALPLRSEEVRMHLETAGLSVTERTHAGGWEVALTRPGHATIIPLTEGDAAATAERVAAFAATSRATGSPAVILTDRGGWKALRNHAAWGEMVGACSVVSADERASSSAADTLSWPELPSLWLGAPHTTRGAAESLALPKGTGLLEGLAHLEVTGRAGRVVAWCPDAVAVVHAERREAGLMVVGASILGAAAAVGREALLNDLDEIRAWPRLRIALIAPGNPGEGESGAEEPVQRIGFFFSRRDDERGPARAPSAGGTLGLRRVAEALVGFGLEAEARAYLRRAERESRWGVEEELLLGYLVASAEPAEAVARLRHAVVRLAAADEDPSSWALQTAGTLNALLLMVRTHQIGARDAWTSIEAWLRDAGTAWVSTPRHAALLFELAARAHETEPARRFAEHLRAQAAPGDPLLAALEPALAAVLEWDA